MPQFGDTNPAAAVERMLSRTAPTSSVRESLSDPAAIVGRVLAEPLRLDRDSPACDVSAMDGFAIRHGELVAGPVAIAGECPIGQPPALLPVGSALRIYTGSPLPRGADTVVRLEWVTESANKIALPAERELRLGQDIRRQAENSLAGDLVAPAGTPLSMATVAATASIGPATIALHRRLRVAVLTTGDEVAGHQESLAAGEPLPPWQLRNSNGPALVAMLQSLRFVAQVDHQHVKDTLALLTRALPVSYTHLTLPTKRIV